MYLTQLPIMALHHSYNIRNSRSIVHQTISLSVELRQ